LRNFFPPPSRSPLEDWPPDARGNSGSHVVRLRRGTGGCSPIHFLITLFLSALVLDKDTLFSERRGGFFLTFSFSSILLLSWFCASPRSSLFPSYFFLQEKVASSCLSQGGRMRFFALAIKSVHSYEPFEFLPFDPRIKWPPSRGSAPPLGQRPRHRLPPLRSRFFLLFSFCLETLREAVSHAPPRGVDSLLMGTKNTSLPPGTGPHPRETFSLKVPPFFPLSSTASFHWELFAWVPRFGCPSSQR